MIRNHYKAELRAAIAGMMLGALSACATLPRPAVLDQTAGASKNAETSATRDRAPQAFARAEQLRLRAEEAFDEGHVALAEALAENALVAFERAALQARLALVRSQLVQNNRAIEKRTQDIAELSALQQKAAQATKQLERRVEIEQQTMPRAPIEAGGGARRASARMQAAKSVVEAAQLLCVSARLLDPEHPGVGAALAEGETLATTIGELPPHEALTKAMDVRVKCLRLLTDVRAAREQEKASDAADVLLSKLSPSVADLRPHRDDRGIVLTAYDVWTSSGELTEQGRDVLDRLTPIVNSNKLPLLVAVYRDGARSPAPDPSLIEDKLRARRIDATVRIVASAQSLLAVSPAEARKNRTEFVLVTR